MVEKGDIKIIKEIKDNMFVDDLTCGGDNEEEAFLIKKKKKNKIIADGGFTLLKLHSNYSILEKP